MVGRNITLHLNAGRSKKALKSLNSAFSLGLSLKSNNEIEHLAQLAVINISFESFERFLSHTTPTESQRRAFIEVISNIEPIQGFKKAIQGERCVGLNILQSGVGNFTNRIKAVNYLGPLRTATGILPQDTHSYLNMYEDILKILELPLHEGHRKKNTFKTSDYGKIAQLVVKSIGPAWEHSLTLCIRTKAKQLAVLTALHIEDYRQQHQKLPDSLNDLIPNQIESISLDPFDGQPLRYQQRDTGYIIYSIGDNCEDNNGQELSPNGHHGTSNALDVTFIVER